ncbi:MAG TPA: FKBP-type peptidyl-prolyl cis-trans isomerase [Solirubrobacterales bacterium]|nr:FKBP-type peptidyl-prolyl cis-trans isomerase [Solirubrobacterales bacterium]
MQSRLIAIGVFLVALVVGVIVISASGDEEDGGAPAEISTDLSERPVIEVPDEAPPAELVTEDIVVGDGPRAQTGDRVEMQYVGVSYSTGDEFDASWDTGQPIPVTLGAGEVIPGWDEGIPGMREGGRRELIIPPDLAYGAQGRPPAIGPNETLVFVVDLVDVKPAG